MSFLVDSYQYPTDEDVFFCIGDSQMTGQGDVIKTLAIGVAQYWDVSAGQWVQLTNNSCNPENSAKGSMFQNFAELYNAEFKKRCCVVNMAIGGSGITPGGSGGYWAVSGGGANLITPALAELSTALTAKGKTEPKAIFISVGHVEARDSVSYANMTSGSNSLLTTLTTEYPGVPILWMITGRLGPTSAESFNQNLYNMRRVQMEMMNTYTDVHCFVSSMSISLVPSSMQADFLHMNNIGLDYWGQMFYQWFTLSSYSKQARGVLASMFVPLSTARADLVADVIDGLVSRGDLFEIEHLSLLKQSDYYNSTVDWTFLGVSLNDGSATFTANDSITTNGTSTYARFTFFPALMLRAATVTDCLMGVRISAKTTAAGVVGCLFGNAVSTVNFNYVQNVANTQYRVNDATFTNDGLTSIAAPNAFSIYRNGTTKGIKVNKVAQHSTVQASTGNTGSSRLPILGGNHGDSGITTFYGASFQWAIAAKFTTFDYDSFHDDMMNLINNW